MAQPSLRTLVQDASETDYVTHFQALARVNLAIRSEGPTAELLMQKAILENDLGNFEAGARSAGDALVIEPETGEAHYQRGLSYLMLALVKARIATTGPSVRRLPREKVKTLLCRAQEEFKEAVRINPADEDASQDLDAVRNLMKDAEEEKLLQELQDTCGPKRTS